MGGDFLSDLTNNFHCRKQSHPLGSVRRVWKRRRREAGEVVGTGNDQSASKLSGSSYCRTREDRYVLPHQRKYLLAFLWHGDHHLPTGQVVGERM